jgi:hypothetical protein
MSQAGAFGRAVAVLAVGGAVLWSPRPAAGEFRINTYTTSSQFISRGVAARGSNEYIAVWSSFQDGGRRVYGQRFTADGLPIGSEFRLNSYTPPGQQGPAVAADGSGGFVVVWAGYGDGSDYGIFGRRYDAAAMPVGSDFLVNRYTTSSQGAPALAVNADGSFVVTWTSFGQDGDQHGIFGQRFDPAGARVGAEFQANTYTTGTQVISTMDADAAGRFVVVWRSRTTNPQSEYGVYGQRFAADGTRLGAELRLTTGGTGDQSRPAVAVRDGGEFIVVWRDVDVFNPPFRTGIRGQWFDDQGNTVGAEFTVSSFTSGFHDAPAAAFDPDGNLLVVWHNSDQDGYFEGVFGQRFDPAGARVGAEFRVNSYTMFAQQAPAVASAAAGSYMVAWTSFNQDGDDYGVFGDVFRDIHPEFLRVDAAGNGVFEAGENAVINPAWRNRSGAPLPFSGMATSFTGPGAPNAPTYSIVDDTADYGAVAHGALGDCVPTGNCYVLATTVPASRPTFHWDATFREDLLPAAPGRSKDWTLHVGESFTDVLPSNLFYRFIETLVHFGVVGGCLPGSYCPSQGTNRDAMAVFVLVAKEGAGYAPPACVAPPIFADVPVSSPFCRWVEELARRGVVGGCGGGNYCPLQTVTREQMAVFVLLTLDPAMNPPACAFPNFYLDVPESNPFCRWIEELTLRRVVTGCGDFNYCPAAPVTREQMSVFVTATFGLLLYGP